MNMALASAFMSKDDDDDVKVSSWTERYMIDLVRRLDVLESRCQRLWTVDNQWLLPIPSRSSFHFLCTWQLMITDVDIDKKIIAKGIGRALQAVYCWLYVQKRTIAGHEELHFEAIIQLTHARFAYQMAAVMSKWLTDCSFVMLPSSYEEETDCSPYFGRVLPICTDKQLASYRRLIHKANVLQSFPNLKWRSHRHAWAFGGKYDATGRKVNDDVTAREVSAAIDWNFAQSIDATIDHACRPLYVLDALISMESREYRMWSSLPSHDSRHFVTL